MGQYSIDDFVETTKQRDHGQGVFELERDRMLEINLNGQIWIKAGAMIAYKGNIRFEREGIMEHGIGKFLKKAVTGEGIKLTKAQGMGALYLADYGKIVSVLKLAGDSIYVNGNDVLAFQTSINWDIKMMKKTTAIMAGGLFNVKLQGTGMVAITTHEEPLTLMVKPGNPVITDPNATVAWSGSLTPQLKTDITMKTFLGRGSGESVQMRFEGNGFVVVQPYEEVYYQGHR